MLEINIYNVGHGQAIHIFTPAGETIVVDLGCSADFSPLEELWHKTKQIDLLVITHPHGDHLSEIGKLSTLGFNTRQINRPKWISKEIAYAQNQRTQRGLIDTYFTFSESFTGILDDSIRVGNPEVSGGSSVDVFYSHKYALPNINNNSGVVAISYLDLSVIIPGDNEVESWEILAASSSFRKYLETMVAFVASHHGRESGYYKDLFISKPYVCIISDGRVQNTDARSLYANHAQGWKIANEYNDDTMDRKCLTTRFDGHINIKIYSCHDHKKYLGIKTF